MKKFALAIMASAAMVLGLGAVANAYPPGVPGAGVSTSATTVVAGGPFTARATCAPAETVTFAFNGANTSTTCGAAGTATASLVSLSKAGSASVTLTAPTTPGSYPLVVTGSVSGALGSSTIVVTGPVTPGGGLPATGSNGVSTMTIIALGLFAVGAGLFGVSQMRRRSITA